MFYCMVGNENQMKAAERLNEKKWKFSNKFNKWMYDDGSQWLEFDVNKWAIQPALGFNPSQADFVMVKQEK